MLLYCSSFNFEKDSVVKTRFSARSKQRGLSLVENIISSRLILFALFSSFLVINVAIKTSVTVEKKVQLIQQIEKNISIYFDRKI